MEAAPPRLFHLLPALFLAVALIPKICYGGDTLYVGDKLTGNQTRISNNGTFELGFFQPTGATKWYVGVWFAQISEQTVVWVANRESALESNDGVFTLTRDGSLLLLDASGDPVWSGQGGQGATRATILDSGNLVVTGENGSVWESFLYPGDTLLPGMNIGNGQKLTSWRSSWDPAPGPFTLELDPTGASQFVLMWNDSVKYWVSGVWNGEIFSGLPEMATKYVYVFSFVNTGTDMYFNYSEKPGVGLVTRFVLDKAGEVRLYTWIDGSQWNMFWSQPRDQCEIFDFCGPYGVCTQNNNARFCDCPQGFNPRDAKAWISQDWSGGCVRHTELECTNGSANGFVQLGGTSLNDPADYSSEEPTRQACESACLRNCSCTAFTYAASNSSSCRLWMGDLFTLHDSGGDNYEDDEKNESGSAFIRVAAADLLRGSAKRKDLLPATLVAVAGCLAVLAAGGFAVFFWLKRQRSAPEKYNDVAPGSLRIFTYRELQVATQNFSERLGAGGFGSVYKGVLPDKTGVAVKTLEGSSQGEKQFRMEVSTIGTIQHVNLVRLRGFCSEGAWRMLVYDYMPNGSLNAVLFPRPNAGQRAVLDWKTRFGIAVGTARGILYLHEKCRDCIIHCDIKPENILLDADFCPKVADFGLAKLVGRDFSHVLTTMRGTRGYLAPEWISGMPITAKADVYSFGMTLLEIVAGRRNLDFSAPSSRLFFPTWAGAQMKMGNVGDLLDARLRNDADMEQVRRVAMVGGWCIQDDEDGRPTMAHVVNVLEGIVDVDVPPVPRSLQLLVEQGADGAGGDIVFSEKALIVKNHVYNGAIGANAV